jgi:diaminohydroxyphosphoribosylaminopyrimidine deaminase / 5-amino-6-(5-phosphoribosylamino)uracil reductase
VCEPEARRLNEKFAWAIRQKMPFVLLKAALTLDGKLATVTRDSQWITSETAREKSLEIREEYDAILVGSGTVNADNPRLTRRLGRGDSVAGWTRVVLDGDGELPPHAQILSDGGKSIVYTSSRQIEQRPGLEVIPSEGRVDIAGVLADLYARGIHSVIIEGGAVIHAEVIRRALWQKMLIFLAPMIVGGAEAPSIFGGEAVSRLTDAYRFRFDRVEFAGRDLMITAYPS